MPYKTKYKDLPEEIKARQRTKALKCWNKKKQDPIFMEEFRAKKREYCSQPKIKEERRKGQNEYYKRKCEDPEYRKHVSEVSRSWRQRKIAEQPDFRERERATVRAWANTINGRVLHLLKHAKKRGQKNGHEVTITKEWLTAKLEIGLCESTGISFKKEAGTRGPYTTTLDRIDNGKGYTEENTRVVIWAFNRAKGEWDEDVLLHWVTEYMRLKNGC
jgi:hypothetical protein